jgi:LacI family transcriptional regulator
MILANELMAVGLYRALAERGEVPGRDIALITLIEQQSMRCLEPRPTHFATDLLGLGDRLGLALQAAMRGDPPVQALWPMQLRPGKSDGPIASL